MSTRISVVGLGVVASLLAHAAALAYVMETAGPAGPPPLPQIELLPVPPAPPTPPAPPAPPAEAKPVPPPPAPPPPEPKPVVKPKPVHTAPVHKAPPAAPPIQPLATTAESADAAAPPAAATPTAEKADAKATAEGTSTKAAVEEPSGPPPDYVGSIRARLERSKRYPASARRAGREGTVTLRFAIDRQGRLLEWRIEQGSDVAALDDEALDLVQRVAPYPPLPDSYHQDRLFLEIPVRYSLRER